MSQEQPSAAPTGSTPYGTLPTASPAPKRRPLSLPRLQEMRDRGEKIAMLTAYDATFAAVADDAGVDCILVGDSLGMVCQGLHSTSAVTLETMRYHTESVNRGVRRAQGSAWIIADLPFGTYHESPAQAFRSARTLMQAGAHMVKLEGGAWIENTTRLLAERGIPVCAHMGLTPQSVNRIGGFHVQGRDTAQAQAILQEAKLLQDAGASVLLLECVPRELAKLVTDSLEIPVIGIGAGPDTTGQIMVLHDVLGVSPITPKFVKNFLTDSTDGIPGALRNYVADVKSQKFPAEEHCFN